MTDQQPPARWKSYARHFVARFIKPHCKHSSKTLQQLEWGGVYFAKCRDCGEEWYERW